jgi:hypothetical protein
MIGYPDLYQLTSYTGFSTVNRMLGYHNTHSNFQQDTIGFSGELRFDNVSHPRIKAIKAHPNGDWIIDVTLIKAGALFIPVIVRYLTWKRSDIVSRFRILFNQSSVAQLYTNSFIVDDSIGYAEPSVFSLVPVIQAIADDVRELTSEDYPFDSELKKPNNYPTYVNFDYKSYSPNSADYINQLDSVLTNGEPIQIGINRMLVGDLPNDEIFPGKTIATMIDTIDRFQYQDIVNNPSVVYIPAHNSSLNSTKIDLDVADPYIHDAICSYVKCGYSSIYSDFVYSAVIMRSEVGMYITDDRIAGSISYLSVEKKQEIVNEINDGIIEQDMFNKMRQCAMAFIILFPHVQFNKLNVIKSSNDMMILRLLNNGIVIHELIIDMLVYSILYFV